jgi:hypothetical protein
MNLRALVVLTAFASACTGSKSDATLAGYPDAPLKDMIDAKQWSQISAPNAYVLGLVPTLLVGVGSLDGGTSDCPVQMKTDTTLHVSGGCTDAMGRQWLGTMDEQQDTPDGGTGHISYAGFGYSEMNACGGAMLETKVVYDGTVTVTGAQGNQQFTVDVTSTSSGPDPSCAMKSGSTATSYQGTIGTNSTWNGSGSTGNSVDGKVHGVTKDEVVDGPCSSEAQSGTTTVTSGSDTVVITYDGATKCDASSTVKWSLNGADMGELTGVRCSASVGLLTAAAALCLLRRRRRGAMVRAHDPAPRARSRRAAQRRRR